MKIAFLTDTHFGARNDSAQFNAYFERFYSEVFFPYLDEHQIKTVIHLGDIFDRRKYINFQILASCKKYFFEEMKKRGIDMMIIPGNHDTYYKNTNEINSLELLLKEYDNIQIINEPCQQVVAGRIITFSPWICDQNFDKSLEVLKLPSDFCIGHFEIAGFNMNLGVKNEEGMSREMLSHFPSVFTGHFHHRSAEDNIYYLGSPYEFTWADHNDPRGFHIFETSNYELTFIQNPNKIFHKIYYDDTKEMNLDATQYKKSCVKVVVAHKNDFLKFDKFIEDLYLNEVIELTIHEDFSEFETQAIDDGNANVEDTMTLLSQFVDSIETTKNKERLKTLLKTLYIEAQNIET